MNEKEALKSSYHKRIIFRILIFSGVMIAIGILHMRYLYIVFTIGLGVLLVVNVLLLSRGRSLKWYGFRYTRTRYYLLLLVFLLPIILSQPSLFFWIKFVAFGIIGIIGESLFGLYWEQLFGEKIWIYQKDTILNGHSSWLNVIPWGIGGFFYQNLTAKGVYAPTAKELFIFWAITLFFFLVVSGWRNFRRNIQPIDKLLTFQGYLILFFPCIGSIVITSLLSGHYHIIVAALFYSVWGCALEYFFGKFMTFILTEKLWVYLPDPIDNGHLTAWSLLPFMFGGFWFVSISHIFAYCL